MVNDNNKPEPNQDNLIAFTMIILGILSVYIIEKFSEQKEWKNMGLLEKN